MSNQACDFCGKLFCENERVEARVLSRFHVLKSARTYAIDKPEECLSLRHYPDCYNLREGD